MRRRSRIQSALADVGTSDFDAVDVARLRPVGQRLPLGQYVRALWGRRHFIWADSRARAFAGNRDTILGLAGEAAHGVERPAAPITTFLAGYAAGLAGGSAADVATAVDRARDAVRG